MFWDSEPIVACFLNNKGENSYMRIPRNFTELHLASRMRVMCHVHGLGLNHKSKQNVLSLILLIPLVELTNQKRGICRHCILYPLRLRLPFPNDVGFLKAKVGLELN